MRQTVLTAVDKLPAPKVGTWQRDSYAGTPDPCAELDAATVTVEMATATSPEAVLLFHRGRFVGPASTCFVPTAEVDAEGPTVTVEYRYPRRAR